MGWGKTGKRGAGTRLLWDYGEWSRAAALCAAQLPAMVLWSSIDASSGDDHGRYDGALGLALLLVTAPVIVPCLGLLHATLQVMPAATLARVQRRHSGGPEWAWHLTTSALVGVCWAVLAHALWGWSLAGPALWFAGAGVLPVLGLAYLRGRRWERGVWLRSAGVSVALAVLVGAAGFCLVDDYEPPVLSAARIAGPWHGPDGMLLTLLPDGTAEAIRVPASVRDDRGAAGCDGTGTWALEREGEHDRYRDGVVVRLTGDCAQETDWTIGGTEQHPELFVLLGDPDAGDVLILTRD
ncbi:hypothetical protein AB0E77_06105 [Streptomyces sp. NPDC032940]|uniref:hypothetical protein n=1 Tax=Streptomyces sp. NPDC032940 TaxID=3155366 RepID=UPI0034004F4E